VSEELSELHQQVIDKEQFEYLDESFVASVHIDCKEEGGDFEIPPKDDSTLFRFDAPQ
jgi:hypothetical protein